jgi:hypothetical protein
MRRGVVNVNTVGPPDRRRALKGLAAALLRLAEARRVDRPRGDHKEKRSNVS